MNAKKNIIEDIQEHQLRWYGHTQQMDDHRLPKKILGDWNDCRAW